MKQNINTIITAFKLENQGITQNDVDFFNVNLDKDNLAFLDYNRILKNGSRKLFRDMGDTLRVFLLALFTEASRSNRKGGLILLGGVKECNDTRLGYSKGKSSGVSIGPIMKPLFLDSLSFLRAANLNDQLSFNTIRLGISGISYDRISDICVSLLLPHLIRYTNEQCAKHNISCVANKTFKTFDPAGKVWHNSTYTLPEFQGKTIIFVPKKLISSRRKAICTVNQFVSYGFKEILQYIEENQHLKTEKGKMYYKDFEEYLKKNNISKKDVAKQLLENYKDILMKFEDLKYGDILELNTEELVAITNS